MELRPQLTTLPPPLIMPPPPIRPRPHIMLQAQVELSNVIPISVLLISSMPGYNNGGNRIDAMTAALLFGTANPFFGNQGASGYGAPGGDTPSQPAQPVLPEGNGNGVDVGNFNLFSLSGQ